MGLALHNPSDFPVLDHKHFPISNNWAGPKIRVSKAKYARWSARDKLRSYQTAALHNLDRAAARDSWQQFCHGKRIHRQCTAWGLDVREGEALARSRVLLPSDRASVSATAPRIGRRSRAASRSPVQSRPPSLTREEAFRDPSTAKTTSWGSAYPTPESSFYAEHDDADVAELYRLGLLYDDERERGAGFGLDTIVHDGPVFSLSVAHTKRGGKRAIHPNMQGWDLPLDMSFADFLTDEEVARLLSGPTDHEVAEIFLDGADSPAAEGSAAELNTAHATASSHSGEGSKSNNDKDILTELPDILEEAPQFEQEDQSHTGHEKDHGEEDGLGDEWAFLRSNDVGDEDDGTATVLAHSVSEEVDTPSSNPDAWIMLG